MDKPLTNNLSGRARAERRARIWHKLDKVIKLHVTLSQKLVKFSEFETNLAKIIFETDGG